MDGLTLLGAEQIEFRRDLPPPVLRDDLDAIVRVRLAGLCGSDLHPYFGREPVRAGTVPGHELVGVIEDAGDAVVGLSPGDLVLAPFTTSCGLCAPCSRGLSARCERGALLGWHPPEEPSGCDHGLDGAQAELVRIPLAPSTLVRVPDGVSAEVALLLGDNFTTGWYGARQAGAGPGRRIAVVGCGAVGLAAVSAARQLGADPVLAVDPLEDRRHEAIALGAEGITPEDIEGRAAEAWDGVVEAVGSPDAQRTALSLVAPGGILSTVGVHTRPSFAFTPGDAYDRNLTYRAGRCPVRSILDSLLPQVVNGEITVPVEAMVSEWDVPLKEGADAYRRFAARQGSTRKLVFAVSR